MVYTSELFTSAKTRTPDEAIQGFLMPSQTVERFIVQQDDLIAVCGFEILNNLGYCHVTSSSHMVLDFSSEIKQI